MPLYGMTKRELARHALGLPNGSNKSYPNRFETSQEGPEQEDWLSLVQCGFAKQSSETWFCLTKKGAVWALDPGETLREEEFPPTDKEKEYVCPTCKGSCDCPDCWFQNMTDEYYEDCDRCGGTGHCPDCNEEDYIGSDGKPPRYEYYEHIEGE